MVLYLDYFTFSNRTEFKFTRSLGLFTCVTNFFNHSIMFTLSHLVNHQLLQIVQLRVPLVQCCIPCSASLLSSSSSTPETWSILPLMVLSRMQLTSKLSTSPDSMLSSPEINWIWMRVYGLISF